MKILTYIVLVCLTICAQPQLHAEISEARKKEIVAYVETEDYSGGSRSEWQPFAEWVMTLTPEERLWTIPIMRKKRDFYDKQQADFRVGASTREEWNGVLAFLGDDEALKAHVASWKKTEMRQGITVQRATSGQVPLYFADGLFIEESPELLRGDAPSAPRSVQVASFMLNYLRYNKHYAQDVRDWAGRTLRNGDQDDLAPYRIVVRKWYRANEAFIRAEQYDKVKPGEEIPPLPDIDDTGARRIDPSQPIRKPMSGLEPVTPASSTSAVAPQENGQRNSLFFAAGFAIFACAIALILVWRRRRK